MDVIKKIEHKFKDLVFWIFNWIFEVKDVKLNTIDANCISKILIIRPEKIGDTVISFPVIDHLKKQFHHLQISMLTSITSYSLVKDDPRFDKIFIYRKNFLKDLVEIIKIRRYKFDCVIDMIYEDSVTSLFLTQLSVKNKPRIGFGKLKHAHLYDLLYDHTKNQSGNTDHIIVNTLTVLSAFKLNPEEANPYCPPFISNENRKSAEKYFQENIDIEKPVLIGYNLSTGKKRHSWPMEKSKTLLESLLKFNKNFQILLFSTPEERSKPNELVKDFSERVKIIPDRLNILQASAFIQNLDIFISPDTSLIHIARSFNIPVVGLYPNIRPIDRNYGLWFPYDQKDSIIYSDHKDYIDNITSKDVFDKFLEIYNTYRSQSL